MYKEQIVVVITGNGANIVNAILSTFAKKNYIPYFAHTINLECIINDPSRLPMLTKIREIVKYMKCTAISAYCFICHSYIQFY